MTEVKAVADARSAAAGASLVMPFLVLNAIVAGRIEPLFSLVRPGPHTSPQEYVLLFAVLLLLPLGSLVAVRPMLVRTSDRLYVVNLVVAASLLGAFALIGSALAVEIYRCDILRIPNCD